MNTELTSTLNLVQSRPHFFPGQRIDYRDLNRLAGQGDQATQLLSNHFFPGGGIILGAFEEFRLMLSQGEKGGKAYVVIHPGIAVSPTGSLVILNSELVVRLSELGASRHPVTVGIQNTIQGSDHLVDFDDPSISGFTSQRMEPRLVISEGTLPADAIELFRVYLSTAGLDLPFKMMSPEEEWEFEENSNERAHHSIDVRSRKYVSPQANRDLSFSETLKARKALYGMETDIRELVRHFLCDDRHQAQLYLALLHAELVSIPFQPIKLSFLLSAFAEKLGLFLEDIEKQVGERHSNWDRGASLALMTSLSGLRVRTLVPREVDLPALCESAEKLHAIAAVARLRYSVANVVELAARDIQNCPFEFKSQIPLGGHAFARVAHFKASDANEMRFSSGEPRMRHVMGRFSEGTLHQELGAFLSEGSVHVPFDLPNPDNTTVILLRHFARRGDTAVEYTLNGKQLCQDRWADLGVKGWFHRSFVVDSSTLVGAGNQLSIQLNETDLDFGVFEIAIYQQHVGKSQDSTRGQGK